MVFLEYETGSFCGFGSFRRYFQLLGSGGIWWDLGIFFLFQGLLGCIRWPWGPGMLWQGYLRRELYNTNCNVHDSNEKFWAAEAQIFEFPSFLWCLDAWDGCSSCSSSTRTFVVWSQRRGFHPQWKHFCLPPMGGDAQSISIFSSGGMRFWAFIDHHWPYLAVIKHYLNQDFRFMKGFI